jgi:hypothetical protein
MAITQQNAKQTTKIERQHMRLASSKQSAGRIQAGPPTSISGD